MAYGVIKVLAASTHAEILVGAGNVQYQSVRILNPNDGVVYVAQNRDCINTGYGAWDWKIPSQSYAILPGPFQTVGVFYLDQSGAGRQGEISFYPSLVRVEEPLFAAIGRAIPAQVTSMDITEGPQPANPAAGILRLWADTGGIPYALRNDGTLARILDSLTALPANSVGGAQIVDGSITTADLAGGAATQVALGSSDGSVYTTTAVNVVAQIPGINTVTITTVAGSLVIAFLQVCLYHSVAGAFMNIATGVDALATGAASIKQQQLAGAYDTLIGWSLHALAAGSHTFYPCWWTSNAGTMARQAWYNSLIIVEFRR